MMDARLPIRISFTLFLFALVAGMGALAWPFRSISFLLPMCMLAATGALVMIQLVMDIRRPETKTGNRDAGRVPAAFAWLLLMPVLLSVAGLVFAAVLYTLAYLRVRARENWTLSLGIALGLGGLLGWIAWLLRMPQMFHGIIW